MMSRTTYFLLSTLMAVEPMSGTLPLGPVRAAYQFSTGTAYSAAVELPSCTIVDLGRDVVPISVNGALTVLLEAPVRELVRWTAGRTGLLSSRFDAKAWAQLNEAGSVAMVHYPGDSSPQIVFWDGSFNDPVTLGWGTGHLDTPYHVRPYGLNDLNQLVVHTQSRSGLFPNPTHSIRLSTNRVDLVSGNWHELARYEYNLGLDGILHQGGMTYEVHDINNYNETVGVVYEDSGQSSTTNPDPVFLYQNEYFAFDRDTELEFEPLQINDAGTILGRSRGPSHHLIILDEFGQRAISPILPGLDSAIPFLSNPIDGLEEIVLENHYWKRMVERDLSGQPTSQPSPDFWQGRLEDLIPDTGPWQDLSATCISASGRIAGVGRWWNEATGSFEDHGFLLVRQALVPDWNRDGAIDSTDHGHASLRLPWRFWINNDDDEGDLARSHKDDLPGSNQPDWDNGSVDGLRDLVDFFPVVIDIQPMLQAMGPLNNVEVVLRQADGALNFVYTSLRPDEVGQLHAGRIPGGFGPAFNESPGEAPVHRITSLPVPLEERFLENIRDHNRNVLLFEGISSTIDPLVMEIRYNGGTVFTHELELSVSPVREMLRILNLRNCDGKFSGADPGPWTTDTGHPPNLPDSFLSAFVKPLRTLVHIHGFNWSGEDIPAAHAEIFKRFFQLGSFARFIGVTWFGDEGLFQLNGTSLDYNENVINAFITAGYFSDAIREYSGTFTSLFAHSLGNLIASSAIVDHGLEVADYFMVNAAVPKESYVGEQPDRRLMVHPDWKDWSAVVPDYPDKLLAVYWHTLFPSQDRRSGLTWKNRFETVANSTICQNFFSSGEEILRSGTGDIPKLFGDLWNEELVWVYNEMVKGTNSIAASLTGDVQGGWGFNREYMTWNDPGGPAHPPPGQWIPMSTVNAGNLPQEALIQEPFFRQFSDNDADFPGWGNGDWLYQDSYVANARLPGTPFRGEPVDLVKNHARILAEAIPAHSSPTGSSDLPNVFLLNNHDMDELFRHDSFWPFREPADKRDRWLHSDYLNPALPFVAKLYQTCIQSLKYIP